MRNLLGSRLLLGQAEGKNEIYVRRQRADGLRCLIVFVWRQSVLLCGGVWDLLLCELRLDVYLMQRGGKCPEQEGRCGEVSTFFFVEYQSVASKVDV